MPTLDGQPMPEEVDLGRLSEVVEMSRQVVEALALAASVVIDQVHGVSEIELELENTSRRFLVRAVEVNERARETYSDPDEATEEAAEAMGIALAPRIFERVVFRRLPKGTGADYLMRAPGSTDEASFERLECSGMARGTAPATDRLNAKREQVTRGVSSFPGRVMVTDFRTRPLRAYTDPIQHD